MDKETQLKHFQQLKFRSVPTIYCDINGFSKWHNLIYKCKVYCMVSINKDENITEVGVDTPWFIIECDKSYWIIYNPTDSVYHYMSSNLQENTVILPRGSYRLTNFGGKCYVAITNKQPADTLTVMDKILLDAAVTNYLEKV